jgi:ATP-dependent Lon protease
LTDSSQNTQFHDKYFNEVDFDLSKCLFIFSYNDESEVNPVLKDRMYRIKTNGYDTKDKMVIARKYMIPKICEQVNMSISDIVIPDDVLQYMISSPYLTKQEQGVRNLKRCLELIYTKLNLFRIVKPESDVLKQFIDMKVAFPYTVSKKDLDVLIRKDEPVNLTLLSMYI